MVKYKAKSEEIRTDGNIDIPEGSMGITLTHIAEHWADNFGDIGVEEYIIVQWLEPVE